MNYSQTCCQSCRFGESIFYWTAFMVRFKDVQCYIFIRVRSRDIINDKVTARTRTRSHVVGGRFSWQESGGGKRKQNNINHPPLQFQWLSSFPLSFPRSFFLFTKIHVCACALPSSRRTSPLEVRLLRNFHHHHLRHKVMCIQVCCLIITGLFFLFQSSRQR